MKAPFALLFFASLLAPQLWAAKRPSIKLIIGDEKNCVESFARALKPQATTNAGQRTLALDGRKLSELYTLLLAGALKEIRLLSAERSQELAKRSSEFEALTQKPAAAPPEIESIGVDSAKAAQRIELAGQERQLGNESTAQLLEGSAELFSSLDIEKNLLRLFKENPPRPGEEVLEYLDRLHQTPSLSGSIPLQALANNFFREHPRMIVLMFSQLKEKYPGDYTKLLEFLERWQRGNPNSQRLPEITGGGL